MNATRTAAYMKVATTPNIDELIASNAPVAIGVSGGKDSSAVAIATVDHLNAIGHTGPRVLIHADLGATEWKQSLPMCHRLAKHLGLELMVVRRPQGDMMDRWEQRWRDNVTRWETLSCVKLILPWSTPSMRFCTSELKVDQICRGLSRRFPGQTIVNASGIRREESTDRAKAPIAKPQPKLSSVDRETSGWDWHPIIEWSLTDVLGFLEERAFDLHEAYTTFGSSRVSCVFCILATACDHLAGVRDPRNHDVARRMVDLEIASTFAFQGNRWLGDTLDSILDKSRRTGLADAKAMAALREEAEARIPEHLLYTKGWPTCVPTHAEAQLLGEVRAKVAEVVGLQNRFVTPGRIIARYEELMAAKEAKAKKKNRKAAA